MFNTERFVIEVQSRECIWNTKIKEYTNKTLRRKAWEEIGEEFNPYWMSCSIEDQAKQIEDYTKKWKNLKDYYHRCKYNGKGGSVGGKKKKPNYFEALSFLDAIKEPREASSNVPDPDDSENSTETHNSDVTDEDIQYHTSPTIPNPARTPNSTSISEASKMKMTPFQSILLDMLQNKGKDEKEFNSNKYFLLSLLPDMDKMNDDQNLEFRISVLNIIKEIKKNALHLIGNNVKDPPPGTPNTGYVSQNDVRPSTSFH